MQRWIARLLVLVMIVPAFGPLALAHTTQSEAPHCLRQSTKPMMECHRGMSMTPEPSETEFHATDQCCENHGCCRGMAAPRWAQPQSRVYLRQGLPTTETMSALDAQPVPNASSNNDSARAPPRS